VQETVGGALSVSRAFGDLCFKTPKNNPPQSQMVTPIPDFTVLTAIPGDILFLGCDGIFENDAFSPKSLGNFITAALEKTDDLSLICGHVLDNCLSRGSFDNMTAILIQLKDGTEYNREYPQYYPGQLFHGPNLEIYQKAYAADAARAGYTLQEAQHLYTSNLTYKLNKRYLQDLKKIELEKNSRKMSEHISQLPRSPAKTLTNSPQISRLHSPSISKIKMEPQVVAQAQLSPRKITDKTPEKKRVPKES